MFLVQCQMGGCLSKKKPRNDDAWQERPVQISLSARAQGSQYTDRQSVASTDSRTILTNAKSDSTSLQLMDAPTISPTASDTSEGSLLLLRGPHLFVKLFTFNVLTFVKASAQLSLHRRRNATARENVLPS
jgi:hypothetical protein